MSQNFSDGTVVSLTNIFSNTVLDLSDSNPKSGTPIIGWQSHGGKNQQWKLVKVGNSGVWPVFKIQSVATGTYVDLLDGNPASHTPVNGWEGQANGDNPHQSWLIISADPSGELVKIKNAGTGTFLDLLNGNSTNGTEVNGWEGSSDFTDPPETHQVWKVKRL